MGAEFNTAEFEGGLTEQELRKAVVSLQEEDALESGCCYSGSWGAAPYGVEVRSEEFDDRDKAEEWLMEKQQKWSEPMAVKVKNDKIDIWAVACWCSS